MSPSSGSSTIVMKKFRKSCIVVLMLESIVHVVRVGVEIPAHHFNFPIETFAIFIYMYSDGFISAENKLFSMN
ncbi:CLUMA_CG009402, isoform A [Clunio marinus]|uniref:CLUMA_CG009402, isoform A n=1 Tax=Clunio marinus TaxID=568069 RepID=A0A1J1I6M3_9DIPT|nr:CLUMA_CG009402, isoform A [Clunio marinus]